MKVNLSLLAQVLAHKVGVEVVEGPHLATNGKVIFVPPDLIGDDEAAVILRGGICHEAVGHIRHTDFGVFAGEKLAHSLLNVIEDIRIEKLAWQCYPGARRILEEMAVTVDGKGWFKAPPMAEDQTSPEKVLLMALLCDMRTRLLQQPLEPTRTADLLQRANSVFGNRWPQVIALAEQGAAASSTAEAYESVKAILALVCNPGKGQAQQGESNQEQSKQQEDGGDQAGEGGQPGDGDKDPSGPQGEGGQGGECDQGSEGDAGASQGDGQSAGQPQGDSGSSDEQPAKTSSGAGQPSADEAGKSSAQTGQPGGSADVTSVVCDPNRAPDVSMDAMIEQFIGSKEVSKSRSSKIVEGTLMPSSAIDRKSSGMGMAARLRADLERLLQSRVQDQEDAITDRGHFDTTRLVEAMMGSKEAFTREQEEAPGLDTEVYMLVDRSGSTTRIIGAINDAVWGIGGAMAGLEGSHLDFGIWYFDDVLRPAKRPGVRWAKEKGRCQVSANGNTNWLGAFLNLLPRLAQSKRSRKVFYTITDGDLGDADAAQSAIRAAEKLGVDLVFLMIDVGAPNFAAQHRNVVASTVRSNEGPQGLQRAIFESLRKSLV